jgi:hypothetical protein
MRTRWDTAHSASNVVRIEAAGQPPKTIEEFTARASTGEERASIARLPAFPPDVVHRDA